jgi:hypothetical protein
VVAPQPGSVLQDTRPEADEVYDLDLDLDLDQDHDVPIGRHSRQAAPAATHEARPSRALAPRGKHTGSGRRSSAHARTGNVAALALADLELPAGEATPEQVDELAEQMLTHLAVTEPQSRLLDPDDFPGGKWGLAGAGLVATIVILLVLYTILGVVFA